MLQIKYHKIQFFMTNDYGCKCLIAISTQILGTYIKKLINKT